MVQRLKTSFIKENRAVMLLLALYLVLSLHRLGDIPTPWYDEITHLNTAWHFSTDGHTWCDFYTDKFQANRMFNSMQFHWILIGAWIRLFGCGIFTARLIHVILSCLTIFFLYIFAVRVSDKRTGIYSALFCASSFIFFHNSRQIMPQVPAALFSVLAFLCFDIARERQKYIFFISTAFFAALAYLSHPIGLGTFFIIAVLFYLRKIPIKFLFIYFAVFVITMLPYWIYVLLNIQEYARQTSMILKQVYRSQPAILNILDEIPVRYFGFPPLRTLYQSASPGSGAANAYLDRLKWMIGYLDLRIMACEMIRSALLILPLLYLGIKKGRTAGEKTILTISGLYLILMSFHPNKFPVYIYILIPYFSVCLALLVNDMRKSKIFVIILLSVFVLTNAGFIYRELFSGKIGRYEESISEIRKSIPPGSVVAGPVYFWPGLYRDYKFVSVNEIVYRIDRLLKESAGGSGFTALEQNERDLLIDKALKQKSVEYVLLTTHYWDGLTEAPGLAAGLGEDVRRYLFNNSQKILDLLRVYYYPGLPETGVFADEVYGQPLGRPGFQNVSEEYQKSLKIYRLK